MRRLLAIFLPKTNHGLATIHNSQELLAKFGYHISKYGDLKTFFPQNLLNFLKKNKGILQQWKEICSLLSRRKFSFKKYDGLITEQRPVKEHPQQCQPWPVNKHGPAWNRSMSTLLQNIRLWRLVIGFLKTFHLEMGICVFGHGHQNYRLPKQLFWIATFVVIGLLYGIKRKSTKITHIFFLFWMPKSMVS